MAPEERRDQWTKPNARRLCRNRSERNPGIGDGLAVANMNMIPDKATVPPRIFRLAREFGQETRLAVLTADREVEGETHFPFLSAFFHLVLFILAS
jgi:hypothetical protein